MPKKKGRNRKKKSNDDKDKPLLVKEDGQEYALVVKVLGSCRFLLNVAGKDIIGSLRGKMRRRRRGNFVEMGSVVLISFRDFQGNVVDILHVYPKDDIRRLKKYPDETKRYIEDTGEDRVGEWGDDNDDEIGFDFEEI